MNITEAIMQRRSVRTYTGAALDDETAAKIVEYAAGLKAPFGAKCRIEMIRAAGGDKPVKLGTYGFIKGASDYLALIVGDGPLAEEGAAYVFEQAVLYCTSLGLGTCWLGGSFSRGSFSKQLTLAPDEKLRIVSPVGTASDKRHLSLISIFSSSAPKPRKPFTANFFRDRFGIPLSETEAGVYARPLEMVRMAPSANNKQPWRVVLDGQMLHFYKSASFGFDSIDLGIALCHFELTCREMGISGGFEVRNDAPEGHKATYVISWMPENR
ncbi:hypothetical protein LJC45_00960 [Alistipes sp. OttesenSCG-928-B03]|nr:hypothetical protein [Alistipes sp. OttesenSCG-928-B03]